VNYQDADCNARVGVPPESLVITWQAVGNGNARVNDKSSNGTFADNATDYNGQARFTFPSLSGCGTIRLFLTVSGIDQGHQDIEIRSIDADIDLERRVVYQSGYDVPTCDLDWDGISGDIDDLLRASAHNLHWRRNALHGTPVQLTTLCETNCSSPESLYIGTSDISWSPNGRWLTHTIEFPSDGGCRVFIASSTQPGQRRQMTFGSVDDYGASWSPLGHELAIGRNLLKIIRKGIPGISSDTTEAILAESGSTLNYGDVTPAISPDGQWVAFARRDTTGADEGAYDIWKVSIAGGTAVQVTNNSGKPNDQYPRWSPDGKWIIFDHEDLYHDGHRVYKVLSSPDPITGLDSMQAVYNPGTGKNAATPAFSPDGLIVTAGIGARSNSIADTRAYTIDPLLSVKVPVLNYNEPQYSIAGEDPILSPNLSPDGTRLALRAKQLHAVRRNMNLPPHFTQIGSQTVHDTTAKVSFSVIQGQSISFVMTATDDDDGARTYHAAYLKSGMSFDAGTRTFTWNNASPSGTHYVKFWVTNGSVPGGAQSGATDAIIVQITVTSSGLAHRFEPGVSAEREEGSDNWMFRAPGAQTEIVRITIVDVAGRRVASISGPAGTDLRWNLLGRDGRKVEPGLYLYRYVRGPDSGQGKLVVVR